MSHARLAACVLLPVVVFHVCLAANLWPIEYRGGRRRWLGAAVGPWRWFRGHKGIGWPLPIVRYENSGVEGHYWFVAIGAVCDWAFWVQVVGLSTVPLMLYVRDRRRERREWREVIEDGDPRLAELRLGELRPREKR